MLTLPNRIVAWEFEKVGANIYIYVHITYRNCVYCGKEGMHDGLRALPCSYA